MSYMSPSDFEARYRADPDPWSYESSAYEREKYAVTLGACGEGPFANALELGASIGVFSAMLAPRCRRLTTIDLAPTAVDRARDRLAGQAGVRIVLGAIPGAIPGGEYDLVVASEILYYLDRGALDRTLARLHAQTVRHGRVVAVHWRPGGPERPFDAAAVHARLRAQPWLELIESQATDDYLLDALEVR